MKYVQSVISIKQMSLAVVKCFSLTVLEDASGIIGPVHRVPCMHTSYMLCPRAFLNWN